MQMTWRETRPVSPANHDFSACAFSTLSGVLETPLNACNHSHHGVFSNVNWTNASITSAASCGLVCNSMWGE